MPPAVFQAYAQALVIVALMALACVFWIVLGIWFLFWRRAPRRDTLAAALSLLLAILFGVQAGLIGVVANDLYLREGQQTYSYGLRLAANTFEREAVVVPIPTDEILLTNLRVDSGDANWSLVTTAHGRGLYVSFVRFANLSAEFTEFSPGGKTRDDTPTMGNLTSDCLRSGYFFVDGAVEISVILDIGACHLYANATAGWSGAEFYCCPPVAN